MPARSIGTATISFGLVSVPVNLYSSSESKASVSFNMLHKKCGSRLKQQYICPKDNEVVTRDDTVKGYEFAKDQYVVLSTEEVKALEEKATGMIDVVEFVPLAKVDREYLDKVYYLGPDKGGDRAYRLLAAALKDTGRAALGQYAARGKQHLVLLRPLNGVLVMEQLHYADEVRPTTEVTIPDGDVKPTELALAKQLIEQTATDDFEPDEVQGHGARTRDGDDPAQDRRPGHHGRRHAGQRRKDHRPHGSAQGEPRGDVEGRPKPPSRCHEASRGNERLRIQGVEGLVLPAGSERRRDARLLRRASFRRSRSTTRSIVLPKEHVLQDWASQVPDPFTFAIKASQRITHYARLKPECASAVEFLLKNTSSLGGRLGPILFQLPPNLKKDVDRLRAFIDTLPADRRYTIEFRHESWFDDDVFDALRERDIPLCIIEQPDFASPVVSTATWGYVRLHRFDYDDAMLAEWAQAYRGAAVERGVRVL